MIDGERWRRSLAGGHAGSGGVDGPVGGYPRRAGFPRMGQPFCDFQTTRGSVWRRRPRRRRPRRARRCPAASGRTTLPLPTAHGAGHERGPAVHQPAPPVEQIASRVTPLDRPADHVRKGHLHHVPCRSGPLRCPRAETRPAWTRIRIHGPMRTATEQGQRQVAKPRIQRTVPGFIEVSVRTRRVRPRFHPRGTAAPKRAPVVVTG